ncbi:uncharacterized protein LOC131226156 [Magnolia sinica]|uniref:uncharacterized protein LOC131226156 n=1 Tax=Magnolia sinica TaxID=86752 RepID=UPI0026592824|nr:uncharacterized protein LOC131226156 [Magnolia sinica]
MDFFKSILSDDPEPSDPENSSKSPKHPYPDPEDQNADQNPKPNPSFNPSSSAWSFGGLIKTLATKSESVIDTYRRDLDEFRSGLQQETAAIREAAARAVKDLPGSLDAGASAATDSLESVGQAIDSFGSSVWRGTAEIISQGKEALLQAEHDSDSSDAQSTAAPALNSRRYSRFESQVMGIQSDPGTYCEDPEDEEEFKKWKSGFELEEKRDEIESLISENGIMEGIYAKLVPNAVDDETFWCRYFYRLHKLKLVEDARANLVKRVISREDEEELSWEVDDDDEEEVKEETRVMENRESEKKESPEREISDVGFAAGPISDNASGSQLLLYRKEEALESNSDESGIRSDEKVSLEGKTEACESSKDSDFSVVSSQLSHEEDELGWDEIEDLGSIDEKKTATSGSPNKADLRKRLSAADEDEDLSWDIEDDEPVKK